MNAISRRCLILLLCLLLPLNALAGLAAPRTPCPMQAAGMTMSNTQQKPDCCQQNESGKLSCKTSPHCQSASLLPLALVTPAALRLSRPLLVTASPEFLPSQSANGVWRPPRN
jgi:hypothetical protein